MARGRMGKPVILTKEALRKMGEASLDGREKRQAYGHPLPYSSERLDPVKARQRMGYGR